jgi:hypothetical protein
MNVQTIRRAALIAAGAFLTLSVPAAAEDVESRPTEVKESASTPAAKPDKKFCITADFTGSRMARKVCRTAKEWERQGVDVGAR